jgi:hypothetical protein
MKIKEFSQLALPVLLSVASIAGLAGCNALNDNPINPDKMADIRAKQMQQMKSYNPAGGPPPNGGAPGPGSVPGKP